MSFRNYSLLAVINNLIPILQHAPRISRTESPKYTFIGNVSVREDCRWADQEILYNKISLKIMIAYCQITYTIPWLSCEQLPYLPEHPRFSRIRQRDKSKMPLLLTPFFGHVSFNMHQELMGCRSADEAVVTSLQGLADEGSCRWGSNRIWPSPEVVMYSCRWPVPVFANGYNR